MYLKVLAAIDRSTGTCNRIPAPYYRIPVPYLPVATTEYRYAGMQASMCAPPRGFMRATARAIDLLLQYARGSEREKYGSATDAEDGGGHSHTTQWLSPLH